MIVMHALLHKPASASKRVSHELGRSRHGAFAMETTAQYRASFKINYSLVNKPLRRALSGFWGPIRAKKVSERIGFIRFKVLVARNRHTEQNNGRKKERKRKGDKTYIPL